MTNNIIPLNSTDIYLDALEKYANQALEASKADISIVVTKNTKSGDSYIATIGNGSINELRQVLCSAINFTYTLDDEEH